MLKGKQGRFRQNLLGKRVDYSGRSVIVSGPSLRLHQCGLPKLMALELFKPFIMARLVERKAVQNIKAAKKMVDSMIPEVWDVLEEVIHEHPVLLNRAPTLHRLGIQAFEPVLVEGKAIQVHPLVCHAFNADFDGDQMAVHVPLSAEAQAEARLLMLSSNNILSPASGTPLATPSQDMVLGIYYLTYGPDAEELASDRREAEAAKSAERQPPAHLPLRPGGRARLRERDRQAPRPRRVPAHRSRALPDHGRPDHLQRPRSSARSRRRSATTGIRRSTSSSTSSLKKRDINEIVFDLVEAYGAPAIAQALDAFKELGFHFSSQAGITISKNNVVSPPNKEEILDGYEKQVTEIEGQYDDGLLSEEDRKEQLRVLWDRATDEVAKAMEDNLDELNPIFMMANSGARGSFKQIRQLAGMRGLMANPKGEIIERPIKANFMEGLSVLEYFISTHGARKGLADTALRTADSGYLTRRLVDVAQDVIIRAEDCKTKDFVEIAAAQRRGQAQPEPDRPDRGEEVRDQARSRAAQARPGDRPARARGDRRGVRRRGGRGPGPLGAQVRARERRVPGLLRPRAGDRARWSSSATRSGIIAAQSIGEPGTQLTMRTFHTGGVAGLDITQGLPRVVELFEARKPKGMAEMAEVDGKVVDRGDRQGDPGHDHRRQGRGARVQAPAARAPAGQARRQGRGRDAARGGLAVPRRPAADPRPDDDRALPRRRGPAGLQGAGRRHQRQAHRADRPPDAEAGADRRQGLDRRCCPARSRTATSSSCLNKKVKDDGGTPAKGEEVILGITKASLATESFLSAASFQETTKVLTDAALEGKRDKLVGLKENVIIGKLIPAATGLRHYRSLEIEPVEPAQRPEEDLLDEDELAAELGLAEDGEEATELEGFGPSFAEELEELAQEIETGTGDGGAGASKTVSPFASPPAPRRAAAASHKLLRWPLGAGSEIHDSVLELIGETPLVRLSRLEPGLRTPLVAKVEYMNPGGRSRTAPALAMIEAAERDGLAAAGRDAGRADLGQHRRSGSRWPRRCAATRWSR